MAKKHIAAGAYDYAGVAEEELKNKVREDWFAAYDNTKIIGKIDFCIALPREPQQSLPFQSFLWAEAKAGTKADINESFVQLILTIGKDRTYEKHLPPAFLGAFDAEKIAFIPYSAVMDVFSRSDFNWNVTPSNHATEEFKLLSEMVQKQLEDGVTLFRWTDAQNLRTFIRTNFVVGLQDIKRIPITKNNFTAIYFEWYETVRPTIRVKWEKAKERLILDADFYLADVLSLDDKSLREKLRVYLNKDHYEIDRNAGADDIGFMNTPTVHFIDGQKAHKEFWNRYERPPAEEYWDYIVERRDLLVPQDVRERKGSFFTPRIWVRKSQEYLAKVLGEDWQDEYYVWDCAAGTGNLLAGLNDKYKVWASTLDQADVDVIKDRIKNGANLLENHVFQFDFLNDSFDKLPTSLKAIIGDPEKRKKLVIYINPPYAETGNIKQMTKTGVNKTGVATGVKSYQSTLELTGNAALELFAQFLIRIYTEIPGCIIGQFSKLKHVQAPNFLKFRQVFQPVLKSLFVVPANTFDNVKGKFPIGFFVWDTKEKQEFDHITADVYTPLTGTEAKFEGVKNIYSYNKNKYLTDWIKLFHDKQGENTGYLRFTCSDIQNNRGCFVTNKLSDNDIKQMRYTQITPKNMREAVIFHALRHVIPESWLNDRDQFLYPKDTWQTDKEFQNDCLAFSLFSNVVSAAKGENNFIPFTEDEVGAKEEFKSHFMTDYMAGKLKPTAKDSQRTKLKQGTLALGGATGPHSSCPTKPLVFSPEAKAVFDAGRELWRYYHKQKDAIPDAAFYDIRLHFQGMKNGKMNTKSNDDEYNGYIYALRSALKTLAQKIAQGVYRHGFLKE